MKQLSCFNLRSFGLLVAGLDMCFSLSVLGLCSMYLYNDYIQISLNQQNDVRVSNAFGNFLANIVDYVLVHNFSNAFYMILAITLWLKCFINFVVASVLMDGIRKKRLICIAPWLINTLVSMFIEIAIFIFMEIKIEEVETAVDKRIIRFIIFGIVMVLNSIFTFAMFALYKMIKFSKNESQALQESIVETSGIFQHVKV